MKSASTSRKFAIRALLPLVVAALPAQARVAELQIERLVTPIANGDNVALKLDWPDTAATGTLTLTADRLVFGDSGYSFRKLRWTCSAERSATNAISCDGDLRATSKPASRLRATLADGQLALRLSQAKASIDVAGPAAASPQWQVTTTRVPATWLQPLLTPLWPAGTLTGGTVDTTLGIGTGSDDALTIAGPMTLASLGLDTADGSIATASLDADGRIDVHAAKSTRVAGTFTLTGGELLAGSVYASLPESPIALQWTMAGAGSRWAIEQFRWSDPRALVLDATATLDTAAASALRTLDTTFALPDAAIAVPRYFDSLLGTVGLNGLRTTGALRGTLQLGERGLDQLDLTVQTLGIADANARFAVDGLDGTLRLHRAAAPQDSKLTWGSAHVHGIALGGTTLALRSRELGLELTQPATLPALGGSITLPRFAWHPDSAQDGGGFDLAIALRDIDLQQLSTAFGWPAFGGTLSGDIPGMRYADSVIDMQGGLALRLFDGDMRIDQLTLERPFGVAPTMTGAIEFSNLDLKPLTGAFGFGEITGRLGGHVRDLRLVDWTPVAFDAKFETSTKAKDPRRISQRAVRDLTEVGGGGIAAGLQAQVLKVFQTFGYARIGLSCTLANDVCRMGGLDGGDGGYTIVEGSGLPRVTVVGHQRQVDWPVLVARLKAASDGQAPIID